MLPEPAAACRACLQRAGASAVPFTLAALQDYGKLLNTHLCSGDGLPQQLCAKCSKWMNKLVQFREMCIASEETLRSQCTALPVEKNVLNIEIKVECLPSISENKLESIWSDEEKVRKEDDSSNEGPYEEDAGVQQEEILIDHLPPEEYNSGRRRRSGRVKVETKTDEFPCGLCPSDYSSTKTLLTHLESHKEERSCGLCTETFDNWPRMLVHRIRHTPGEKYICHVCNKNKKDGIQLEAHLIFKHFGGTEVQCKYCHKCYKNYRSLYKHIHCIHKGVPNKEMVKCAHCPKKFGSKSQLKSHSASHANTSHVCDVCGVTYKNLLGLKNHILKTHSEHAASSFGCGLCEQEHITLRELQQHLTSHMSETTCRICKKSFADWPELIAHRHAHVGKTTKYYECHICWKNLASPATLELHLRGDHHLGLQCKLCGKGGFTAWKLRKHMTRHRNPRKLIFGTEKKYICDKCDYASHYYSVLQVHIKRLHEHGSFPCDQCTKTFSSEPALQEHSRRQHMTHTAVTCQHCGKKCESKYALKSHLRIHKNKTYKCDLCPSTFKTKGNLVIHINRHDGNRTLKCLYCPAKFYSRNVVDKHMRTHTGEKPYVCKICKKGFTGGHNLKVHMKVHGLHLVNKKKPLEDQSLV